MHGTHCWREDPQQTTGVRGYLEPGDVRLQRAFVLPFEALPDDAKRVTSKSFSPSFFDGFSV
jgi:hypothetical protein